jgi:hypothetical protein
MLKQVYESVPETRVVKPITLRRGFDSLSLHLYDEQKNRLIGFKEATRRA